MRRPDNLAGCIFGRLTAQCVAPSDSLGKTQWQCACSCGGAKVVRAMHLKAGQVTSCGCAKRGPRSEHPLRAPAGDRPPIVVDLWEGVAQHGYVVGFARYLPPDGGPMVGIKAAARKNMRTKVSVTQMRMLNALRDRGLIDDQGDRSSARWIADWNVQFQRIMTAGPALIYAEFARITGVNYRRE